MAEETDFQIVEINPSIDRSGKQLIETYLDPIKQQLINLGKKTVFVFEEVDILFAHETEFWPAVNKLMYNTKHPIIMTSQGKGG